MSGSDRQLVVAGVDGRSFPVADAGPGRPILLVHGGSNGPGDGDRVADRLAVRFRVLRFPRFTYRSAPPPPAEHAMPGEVHDVLALAKAIREPVVAVGHSSGAVVVLESALADPSRFAGMLLYEPPVAVTESVGCSAPGICAPGSTRWPGCSRASTPWCTCALHGHGAHRSAPGKLARIIAEFAERVHADA